MSPARFFSKLSSGLSGASAPVSAAMRGAKGTERAAALQTRCIFAALAGGILLFGIAAAQAVQSRDSRTPFLAVAGAVIARKKASAPAIKTGPSIDSDKALGQRFLAYQLGWINEDHAREQIAQSGQIMELWEKSFRIGATWTDAFKNVRKRLHHAKRDYLFATRDFPSALEFLGYCKQHLDIYNLLGSIVMQGEDWMKVDMLSLRDGKSFTEEIKVGTIKFDNGSRIIAFSSNPNAMLVFGGDVGLDEYPRHEHPEQLWQVAKTRATMGYDISVWGSHRGNGTMFYRFAQQARAGRDGWAHKITTIHDAINDGLVEMINRTRGTKFTREQFLENCKRGFLPGMFAESYECNAQGGTDTIVPWTVLQNCTREYDIPRFDITDAQVREFFGAFHPGSMAEREGKIHAWMTSQFGELQKTPRKYRLGFDVAASGNGDLGCFYIDGKEGDETLQCRGLLTTRTEDWHFMKCAARWFMRNLSAIQSRGDETGLGRNVCWELAQEFPGQFAGVNFSTSKADLGTRLMSQLSEQRKLMPANEPDIAGDYYAIHKTYGAGGKLKFLEGANDRNELSHCDIAWAGALASEADGTALPFAYSSTRTGAGPQTTDRGGALFGSR